MSGYSKCKDGITDQWNFHLNSLLEEQKNETSSSPEPTDCIEISDVLHTILQFLFLQIKRQFLKQKNIFLKTQIVLMLLFFLGKCLYIQNWYDPCCWYAFYNAF